MSHRNCKEIVCPRCDSKNIAEVWQSLNAQVDPDAKTRLLRGEINVFQCKLCGFSSAYPAEMLYHDMENRYYVQLVPIQSLNDWSGLARFTDDGLLNVEKNLPQGYVPDYFSNVRVVFSMEELVNYINFRDKLVLRRSCHHQQLREEKGEQLLLGVAASPGVVKGFVRNIGYQDNQLMEQVQPGEIIVAAGYRILASNNFLKMAAAFVTDGGGRTCSAAIVARELKIPAVTGTKTGSVLLKTGQKVIVDGSVGAVYSCAQ